MAAGDPYFDCDTQLSFSQVFKSLVLNDGFGNPILKTGESDLDPYFNCDNNHISTEQILKLLIIQDTEGNPVLNVTE